MAVPDEAGGGDRWYVSYFRNIQDQEPCQDSSCPPSLFLESWRTQRFLMSLELVSDIRDHLSEASVKVSSRSNIRNLVKTPPVLQVSSWRVGGHGGYWWTWRWYQMMGIILQKHLWKFHQDPTSGTLSKQLESIIIMCRTHTHTHTHTNGHSAL